MKVTRWALLALLLCAASANAADKIKKIIVVSTTGQTISEQMVRANIKLREGGVFSKSQLSEDIKTLYATKQFADIQPDVEPAGENLVNVFFKVKLKGRVEGIYFQGNQRVKTKTLRKKLFHKEGEILQEQLLADDLAAIYKLYRGKGYSEVEIKREVTKAGDTEDVNITYQIQEHQRHKTRGLKIVGNTVLGTWKIKRMIKTGVSFWGYVLPVGYFDDNVLKTDLDVLKEAYWNQGYLDFKIDRCDRVSPPGSDKMYVTIHLNEGQQYTVSGVAQTGNKKFGSDELANLLRLRVGDVYSHELENVDLQAIMDQYYRYGYLDCRVRVDRVPDSASHTVAISYGIVENLPSTIRDVNISGNRITKDHVIRRELQIHPGDLSDGAKVKASKARLMNLGYFSGVDIVALSTGEAGKKDLSVKVAETETGRLMLGAGLSSVDNVLGTVEVAQSNFDLKGAPSFRGGGQRFRLRAEVGSSRQDFVLSFTEPWLMHRPLRLDYEAWSRNTSSNRDWDQENLGTGVTLTRKLGMPYWRQSFGYRIDNVEIDDIDDDFSAAFIANEEDTSLASALNFGVWRDHRNSAFRTSSGSVVRLGLEWQSEGIGSYTDLYKARLSGDKYFPVFKKSVLKLSGRISQVDEISGDDMKVFDRFFAGGLNSIRGFKERSVGPIDPGNEEAVGGKSSLLASAEMMAPIFENVVYWAAWVDTGNVWEGATDWDVGEMNVGAGLGVRFFLPIGGAFVLDYGWPVNREQEHLNKSGRLHFNLGYSF